MPARKYIVWAAVACAIFYLIKSPTGAASAVQSAATGLSSAADSVAVFVNKLAS